MPFSSVIFEISHDELLACPKSYLVPVWSVTENPPPDSGVTTAYMLCGGAYPPAAFLANRTCRPSARVRISAPEPSGSGTRDMSAAEDQPAPNACEVRGSSELYVRRTDSAGPTVATLASVACID